MAIRQWPLWKWTRRLGVGAVVFLTLLVAGLLATLSVDLGPTLRTRAEQAASNYLERPMHIGALKVRLLTGQFVVKDLVIEGVAPTDRPFFTAREIVVSVPWWSFVRRRELLVESIEMTDWQMLVESFGNGRNNLPRLTPRTRSQGRRWFTTTFQLVRAARGRFEYVDHGTWSVVAPNLNVLVSRLGEYRGEASSSGGTVAIKDYVPMWTNMRCGFTVDGAIVRLHWIDLETDGAHSLVNGDVDFGHWPEQFYRVQSRVQLPRMREIFFAGDSFTATGRGGFTGTFHIFKGGYTLKGDFASDLMTVNTFRFPDLRGSLVWSRHRFDITEASSRFYDGTARFTYSIAPIDAAEPAVARFDVAYQDVDLGALTDFLEMKGFRLGGRASGRNLLEWPLGRYSEHRGEGQITVQPPADVRLLSQSSPLTGVEGVPPDDPGGTNPGPLPSQAHLPIGGELKYRFGPEWITLDPSWVGTSTTYIEFQGETAYGDSSTIPFRVRSASWQESDRLLAAVLTAFGSPTGTVTLGGHGEFDGMLRHSFSHPRIEGTFRAEQARAWNVIWGDGGGSVVFEGGFVDVTGGHVSRGTSSIRVDGRFSLSYPRRDGNEEVNARFQIADWDLRDLMRAFGLDAYPLYGVVSGEGHLFGRYSRPFGFGRATIADGVAYGETYEQATASLRFEGTGARIDAVRFTKSTGTITGAAHIGWSGNYTFNADGRRIPLESLASVKSVRAPLSGLLEFSASGTGRFQDPQYEGRVRVDDLFISDEGIGQVTGRASVRDELLTAEFEAASPRLAVSGTGRIALTPGADAEVSLRFTDTSLDPYVRAFEPRLSPFTTAVASGTMRIVGQLGNLDRLLVEGNVEQLDLRLFDYQVRNDGILRLSLDRRTVRLQALRLVGEDTKLDVSGVVDLANDRIAIRASGDANLGILQGFFRNIRSSGRAELVGEIQGPLRRPVFSGHATIANGRIRYFSMPHSLSAINGRISFGAGGINIDDVVAQVGEGQVRFGGRIGFNGYVPDALDLTATGTDMRLRFPEGVNSLVDADLALVGTLAMPTLRGQVNVRNAAWSRRLTIGPELLDLVSGNRSTSAAAPAAGEGTLPLRFDVRVLAPSTLQIKSNLAQIVSSADLTLSGTYDHPVVMGHVEVERGTATFEGKRYVLTHGTVDFSNPTKIEPFFDVEAETQVRAPGQTYVVDLRVVGTMDRLEPQLSSDPPLPQVDILSLLFSNAPQVQDAELRALQQPYAAQEDLIRSRATQLLASPISSEVGRVVEQTFGLDTFQITPQLVDPYQRLNPTARLTIGKRISDRVYLTFSRSLVSSARDQIILLEYDESDRLSWILSQNEDRTYALDVRVRHTF